jgi:6-phosphogluconolactonase
MEGPIKGKARRVLVPGNYEQTVRYSATHWIETALAAIKERGRFNVALSGGSTPKAIFETLGKLPSTAQIDWKKVHLFWSDERAVPPSDPESNYHMALSAGLGAFPIPANQIHRMVAEEQIEENARAYESLIENQIFDLIMLGMGDDGHTASLFPHTEALHAPADRLVVANYLPSKKVWRMSFTYSQLLNTRALCLYVLGKGKADILLKVLQGPYQPEEYPSQAAGSEKCPAIWILDQDAASKLSGKSL